MNRLRCSGRPRKAWRGRPGCPVAGTLVERRQKLWLEVQPNAKARFVWLPAHKNPLAFRDVTAALKLVKRRCVKRGLLRREVADRANPISLNKYRWRMGVSVVLVTKTTSNNDAFSLFHSTGADLSQMTLIRLLANDFEVEASMTHVSDGNLLVGGRGAN